MIPPEAASARGFRGAYMRLAGKVPRAGADTVVWLATSGTIEGVSDRFWVDRRERACRFRDPTTEERLSAPCSDMTR